MAHSSSGELAPLDRAAGEVLLDVADRAIRAGLSGGPLTLPDPGDVPQPLDHRAATFVTVLVDGELNGCIGSVEASEPLVRAVARHAWEAAFEDPRLPPLRDEDYERMAIEVSVLSALTPAQAGMWEELVAAVRPGVDGLLIAGETRRAVFLPSVWATLPSAGRFVSALFEKAGLRPDPWPVDLRAWTFTAQKISDRRRGGPPATLR